jgi:hypothetical protein
MTLKETLDKITFILRSIKYASEHQSKDELISLISGLVALVGDVLVQRDSAAEMLNVYNRQLWISHIVGNVDCPGCANHIPLDFYVGSKGVTGKPIAAMDKDALIELLEFPPITKEDVSSYKVPDYMPDL